MTLNQTENLPMKKFSLLAVLFLLATAVLCQRPFKFGKVTDQELNLASCDFFPAAKSMILGEFGDLKFRYDDDKGWQYKLQVTKRVKIFDVADARDQANIKIKLYQPTKGANKEELVEIKGFVYNQTGGAIEKEKLGRKEVFETRLNDYWIEKSFAVPNVVEGTVFEYTYSVISDYLYNLKEWNFQGRVPVKYSEFKYTIPQYFNYQSNQLGGAHNVASDEAMTQERFTYSYTTLSDGLFGSSQITGGEGSPNQKSSFTSQSKKTSMAMSNVPPVEEEPYQTNFSDIPSRLEFQLISTHFPSRGVRFVADSYENFNQEVLQWEGLGDRLDKGKFLPQMEVELSGKSDLDKAISIYDHICSKMTWDGYNAITSKKAGKIAYSEGKGNVAAINLTLIALLRNYGIKAYPIILSTRGHGTIHPVYPILEDFNYLIVAVNIDGKNHLLDASSNYSFGQIPLKCRNGKGWLVSESGGQMVDLKATSQLKKYTTFVFDVNDQLKVDANQTLSGYAAYDFADKDSITTLNRFKDNLSVDDYNIEKVEMEKSKSDQIKFHYELTQELEDEIYIQPFIEGTILENPFKRDARTSIVDFPYTQSYRVVAQINLPEGYVAEVPEPARVNLPDKKGVFSYRVTNAPDKITIISDVKVNQSIFGANDYGYLKQFYQMVTDKNQELVVLTKK